MKKEYFLTSLAIFEEPVDASKQFQRERANWEKIIQHREDLPATDVVNINVTVNFPESFSSADSDHLQSLIAYWNGLTRLLETAISMRVQLFQFEFPTEMKHPITVFRSARERREAERSSPNKSEHGKPKSTTTKSDQGTKQEDSDPDSDDDDDKELDDTNFDVYWKI